MAWKSFIPEATHWHPGRRPAVWICSALFCMIGMPEARADFVGYYAPVNFTFTDIIGGVPGLGNPNGLASFPDAGTLELMGSNDGSGLEGTTDLTIRAGGTGLFQFHYMFVDLVPPTADPFNPIDPFALPYGGYLVNGMFFQLSNALGGSGSVGIPVTSGEVIGFRVGGDNQGGPGQLTITNFAAPVPEPGTFYLLAIAAAAALAKRRNRRHASTIGSPPRTRGRSYR